MLGCEGDSNVGVGSVGDVVAYMGGTRASCAGDVLEMSVVRGVGGVCDNSGGTWGKWDMCLCFGGGGVGGVGGEWVGGLGQGLGGWSGVMSVCVVSLDSLC